MSAPSHAPKYVTAAALGGASLAQLGGEPPAGGSGAIRGNNRGSPLTRPAPPARFAPVGRVGHAGHAGGLPFLPPAASARGGRRHGSVVLSLPPVRRSFHAVAPAGYCASRCPLSQPGAAVSAVWGCHRRRPAPSAVGCRGLPPSADRHRCGRKLSPMKRQSAVAVTGSRRRGRQPAGAGTTAPGRGGSSGVQPTVAAAGDGGSRWRGPPPATGAASDGQRGRQPAAAAAGGEGIVGGAAACAGAAATPGRIGGSALPRRWKCPAWQWQPVMAAACGRGRQQRGQPAAASVGEGVPVGEGAAGVGRSGNARPRRRQRPVAAVAALGRRWRKPTRPVAGGGGRPVAEAAPAH